MEDTDRFCKVCGFRLLEGETHDWVSHTDKDVCIKACKREFFYQGSVISKAALIRLFLENQLEEVTGGKWTPWRGQNEW